MNEEPKTATEWYYKGVVLVKLGHYEEALNAFDQALKINPKDATAWCFKGVVLVKLGHYEEALNAFDQALEIDPKLTSAWNNKGVVLNRLGRYEEALKAFDQAITIAPKYAKAWCNKGVILGNLGRYKEALKAFDQALKIDPKLAAAWFNKGVALDKLGRHKKALKAFDQALEIDPKDASAWNGKGVALYKFGRYKEALKAYDQAIRMAPEDATARSNLGVLLFELGHYKEARKQVEAALTLNDKLVPALILLGRIEVEDKRYLEAVELFNKAVVLSSGDQIPILWKAYAKYLNLTFSPNPTAQKREEELSSIMRELERAKELSESHKSEILYFLGYFYYKSGDIVSAKIKLEECFDYKPEAKLAKLAKELLAVIWNHQIRPLWWQWWLGAPKPLAPWCKRIVFVVVLLAVIALLFIPNFIAGIPISLLIILGLFFIFILVSPTITYFKAREIIEVELKSPPPFEPVLTPSVMEEIIKAEKASRKNWEQE